MKLSEFELVSQVNSEDESYFTWRGCDNEGCEEYGKGADVYDCQGYKTLAEAQADSEGNLYEFALCFSCLYEYSYSERPE